MRRRWDIGTWAHTIGLLCLLLQARTQAATIVVNDASNKPTANCTLLQAMELANITANGGPPPWGQTPPGSTTRDPLLTNYVLGWEFHAGSCAVVPDARAGTVIDLAAIAGATIVYPGLDYMYTNWYGWTALPPVAADITIDGHNVTLVGMRSEAHGRLFFVGADPQRPETPGYNTPGAGKLTLINLTLTSGGQKGQRGGIGGGGAGMGGAIFNQGTLNLIGVTLSFNRAIGGGSPIPPYFPYREGGGMASYQVDTMWGMGNYVTYGSEDAGLPPPTPTTAVNGRAGGGTPNGLGGSGGATLGCCGYPGGSGGTGGNGSGGGGGGGGAYNITGGTPPVLVPLDGGAASGGGFRGGLNGGNGTYYAFGTNGVPNSNTPGGGEGGGIGGGGIPAPGGGGGGGFGGGGGSSFGGVGGSSPIWQGLGGNGGFGGGGGGSAYPITGQTAKGGYGAGDAVGAYGGGGAGMGGAIFNHGGVVTLLNSTLTDNIAYLGGGGMGRDGSAMGAAIFNLNGLVTVSFSTLAYNSVAVNDSASMDCCPMWGDAIYSVAYNGAASTGSTQARVVIHNSVIVEHPIEGSGSALVLDQPTLVSGGLNNVATQTFQASGVNLVRLPESLHNAPVMPNFNFDFFPNLQQSNATGIAVRMPLEPALLGAADCNDAFGNPVATDQRGLPRPPVGCDIGATQRQRPLLGTSPGNAVFVQATTGVAPAIAIDAGIGVADNEPSIAGLASASVTISGNYVNGEDLLSFIADAGTMGNIQGAAFDVGSGRLLLSSSGASATVTQWQAALRAVSYRNTTAAPTQPTTALRTISFTISDGYVGSNPSTRSLQVKAATFTSIATPCTLRFIEHAPFTVSANVSAATSGLVTFWRDGSIALCSNVAVQSGSASCTTTSLATVSGHAQDNYAITAAYAGDATHASSISAALGVAVLSAADVVFGGDFEAAVAGCH